MEVYRFETSCYADETTCPYTTCDNLHFIRETYERIGSDLTMFMIENGIPE
ncbi:MAG: hypothetical protein IJP98_04075 [Clostridia bacterium]|nr:hypothetical protein [Clostridia bacterium]